MPILDDLMDPQKTPLHDAHARLNAKIVDFHGWLMPIHYTSIVQEHEAVRTNAGLFDVSHMGEFLVYGSEATLFINKLVTNDVTKIDDKQCMYTPMCIEEGGIVDDLIVYRHSRDHYMLVVNASNIEKDFDWVNSIKKKYLDEVKKYRDSLSEKDLVIRNVSDKTSLIALQGPASKEILPKITDEDVSQIKRFHFAEDIGIGDAKTVVSRTGYTGEDGFEIYLPSELAHEVWDKIMDAGKEHGIMPCGLGARDTLRLESALMLYGNDIDEKTTPLEAPLTWTVKLDKNDFIGKEALLKQKNAGVKKKLVGFELTEKGIPRSGYELAADSEKIGYVTSGTYSPTLKKSIGLGYVKTPKAVEGTEIEVIIRDKPVKAKTVKIPFYKRV
ncbi:MAG: glycine cleavage system aminomethyltransferase GcvT [Candidatus Altiarchaeota archaeon]|nr:glycine cleavage system aminomethyltransferase GcvT [Candidatus Altiarchaeota archaeon]